MFENVFKSNHSVGIELFFGASAIELVNVYVFEKRKNAVVTKHSESGLRSLEEILPLLTSSTPVQLCIQGKGIIHKKVYATAQENEKQLLNKVLPNARIEDFYMQRNDAMLDHAFISIIRKEQLDGILAWFSERKIAVHSAVLGPFVLTNILPLLQYNAEEYELNASGFSVKIQHGIIDAFETSKEDIVNGLAISLGGEMVNRQSLIAFATGFSYFLNEQPAGILLDVKQVILNKENFKQEQIFKKTGMGVLAFFLGLLLINYVVFDHYWQKKKELENKISLNQGVLTKYEMLEKEYEAKQQFFEKAGLLGASRASYYADRLVADMPNTISLTSLQVYPMNKKANDDTTITFLPKVMRIVGRCRQSIDLNEWMRIVKYKPWVNDLTLQNYKQDKEEQSAQFNLELKIK